MEERLSKAEIEEAIKDKDDFIKIDYLKRFLQKADNHEMKKFILLKLTGVCEAKNMLNEAVTNIRNAAEISITYREKIEFYMKAAELYIKLRDFENSDKVFKMAYSVGNSKERPNIIHQYKESFRMQASIAEKNGRARYAIEMLERLIRIDQPNEQRIAVRDKLVELYEKMGRMDDASKMKSLEIG